MDKKLGRQLFIYVTLKLCTVMMNDMNVVRLYSSRHKTIQCPITIRYGEAVSYKIAILICLQFGTDRAFLLQNIESTDGVQEHKNR